VCVSPWVTVVNQSLTILLASDRGVPYLLAMATEYDLTPEEQRIADSFHELYYHKQVGPGRHRIWEQTKWMGYPVLKTPADLWNYQEILHELRPDLVIET